MKDLRIEFSNKLGGFIKVDIGGNRELIDWENMKDELYNLRIESTRKFITENKGRLFVKETNWSKYKEVYRLGVTGKDNSEWYMTKLDGGTRPNYYDLDIAPIEKNYKLLSECDDEKLKIETSLKISEDLNKWLKIYNNNYDKVKDKSKLENTKENILLNIKELEELLK